MIVFTPQFWLLDCRAGKRAGTFFALLLFGTSQSHSSCCIDVSKRFYNSLIFYLQILNCYFLSCTMVADNNMKDERQIVSQMYIRVVFDVLIHKIRQILCVLIWSQNYYVFWTLYFGCSIIERVSGRVFFTLTFK